MVWRYVLVAPALIAWAGACVPHESLIPDTWAYHLRLQLTDACVILGPMADPATLRRERAALAHANRAGIEGQPGTVDYMLLPVDSERFFQVSLAAAAERGGSASGYRAGSVTIAIADWLIAMVLTPLAAPLVVALWKRRRRRLNGCCIQCGYSLFGLTSPRCPECGRALPAP